MGLSGYSSVHCPPGWRSESRMCALMPKQAQFEYLEQSRRAGADDDHFGGYVCVAQGNSALPMT